MGPGRSAEGYGSLGEGERVYGRRTGPTALGLFPFPWPRTLGSVQAGLPVLLMQDQEEAVSCLQDEGEGLGHAWSCGTEQRSHVPWKCLPVQVVGAVACNNSYRHIEDFIVFELKEKNVCEWGWGKPCH